MQEERDLNEEPSWAMRINKKFLPREVTSAFLLTIVIPVYNCSDKLLVTLESIKRQKYSPLEVIVVDAGSSDRTLEIARSFFPLVSRTYAVTKYNLFEMINRGISLAGGRYVTIMIPGSYYLSEDALSYVALEAITNREPELITCGSIQRERGRQPRYFHYSFDQGLLARGIQSATLSACFFEVELFDKIGTFSKKFSIRGGFEFLCRISRHKEFQVLKLDRVFVDFDFGAFTYGKFAHYASDTCRILYSHFGFWKAFVWFLGLSHIHLIRGMAWYFKKKL